MLFSDFARTLSKVARVVSDRNTMVVMLTELFQRADFGDVGPLLALCRQNPAWQIHPWLEESVPEDLLMSYHLPEPHTLSRIFVEMQRIVADPATPLRRQVMLASLDSISAAVAERLLHGRGFVEPAVLEAVLATVEWRVGWPILPEKLVRRTSLEIEQVWQDLEDSYGHVKDDGYYCQLHKLGERVLVFVGANLLEQTSQYPEVIKAVQRQVKAESATLEGELVGLAPRTDRVLPRRQMMCAARYQVRLFDLLGVNDCDWREQPYALRREERLSLVVHQPSGALCHAREFALHSAEGLHALFEQCQAEGWEGLVIKQAGVSYQSGLRNPACVKLKIVEPVDVTIVGYFLSAMGEVETFLLALYNEETGQFEACGRTQAGLSPEARRVIQTMVRPYTSRQPVPSVIVGEVPDVWVEPVFVFELRADYRHPSDRYPCAWMQTGQGWALHNPVFLSAEPRSDKDAHHTTSIDQFLSLRVEAGQVPKQSGFERGQSPQAAAQQLGFTWDVQSSNGE